MRNLIRCSALGAAAALTAAAFAAPASSIINYQGRLVDGGLPANGTYDMEFGLFVNSAGGAALVTICVENVQVTDGLFTANLNFGTAFEDGGANFLGIRVRADNVAGNCGIGVYTALSPRQPILAAPYAICALKPDGFSLDASDGSPEDALFVDSAGRVGIGTTTPGSNLDVAGIIRGTSFVDRDSTSFSLDPANTSISATIAGSIDVTNNHGIQIGTGLSNAANAWTIGGDNVIVRLGDTTADQVVVPAKDFYMGDTANVADGDQNIFFTDNAVATDNVIRWDDLFSLACGDNIGQIDSRFEWHIEDNAAVAWMFTSGSDDDPEVTIDELGAVNIDSTLTASNGCDLAEAFLGSDDLKPGTVVVLDQSRPESVIASSGANQAGIVGVVSTFPSLLMRGATADVYPLLAQIEEARAATLVTDAERALLEEMAELDQVDGAEELVATRRAEIQSELSAFAAARKPAEEHYNDLERQIDGALRGNVKVALVGRVPVRVTGPVHAGDYLTTSDVPGVAKALDKAGPTLGVAISDFDGAGEGSVIAVIQPGWHGANANVGDAGEIDALRRENAELRSRLSALESKVDALLRR